MGNKSTKSPQYEKSDAQENSAVINFDVIDNKDRKVFIQFDSISNVSTSSKKWQYDKVFSPSLFHSGDDTNKYNFIVKYRKFIW